MSVEKLKENDLWHHGPLWLNDKDCWPTQKSYLTVQCPVIAVTNQPVAIPLLDGSKFSTLRNLLRLTEHVFRFIQLSTKDATILPSALQYWLRVVQKEVFSEEISYITDASRKIPELVRKLGLYLEDGLLRCRGRIEKSEMTYAAKNPIILPKKHWLTKLLIVDIHELSIHGGVQDTLCKIRENYWIPQGRQAVKQVISKCYMCKVLEGQRCTYPPPPPLPAERVMDLTPFEATGVDYTGALNIRDSVSGEYRKVYVALFTCATTRAVHLELALDLTAETFLNVFRRFVAERSCPAIMISDNARNFQQGAVWIRELLVEEGVQRELAARGCKWKFIAPKSPWQGGFYERLIGLTKSCLKKALFRKKVSIEDLRTVLKEVQCRLNNRPITYMSDDINDLEALTPSHLIYGRRIRTMPSISRPYEEQDPTFLDHEVMSKQFRRLSGILNRWQDLWKKEYLASLREKFYGVSPGKPLRHMVKEGDVVLVQSVGPREEWPLGRVLQTYPDERGAIRLVRVKMRSGEALRSVEKLVPLEIEVEKLEYQNEDNEAPDEPSLEEESNGAQAGPSSADAQENVPGRQPRATALRFKGRLQELINSGSVG